MIKKHSNVIDPESIHIELDDSAGIDEVGRGPLAGPVVAAAVVLGNGGNWEGVKDSKGLTPKQRTILAENLQEQVFAWALGRCEVGEIDTLNIFNASLLAMRRAFEGLRAEVSLVLVDGKFAPELSVPSYAVIKGDSRVTSISAASILAKVERDREMQELDQYFPQYGFAQHKGYPTAKHIAALHEYGPCPHHRQSFKPVRAVLKNPMSI